MNIAVVRKTHQVTRPLKVLVPLIKEELVAGNEAGLDHYRRAGEMLMEAREQVAHGSWARWLTQNFELSKTSAYRYMKLADRIAVGAEIPTGGKTLREAVGGPRRHASEQAWQKLHAATNKVNVTRLADERQTRENEVKLHREMALQLIDLGYRAMATRLHPDRGGSKDAMMRLNHVRDELKSIAETRRFE